MEGWSVVKTDTLQRKRVKALLLIFSATLLLLLIFRVGYWQILKSDWLREQAVQQWVRELPVEPKRGDIQDRNGNTLAVSVSCDTVVLHPKTIKDENLDHVVEQLSSILNMDNETVRKKATKNYSVVWLKRQITEEQADRIRELDLEGVALTEDKKRYYPLGNFLTQVLGFTSIDGEGLEGIESRFDRYLRGTPGSIVTETDRDGRQLPGSYEEYVPPVDGNHVRLTIDTAIQSYAEKAMDLCLTEQKAKTAMCVVMNPNTGEILAMVNKPGYDSNEPPRHDIDLLRDLTRNKAIGDVYEPGSTFKVVTMASALDSGAINTGSTFYCPRYKMVDGQKIKCWSDRPHGHQTLVQAAQNSCNPAFMEMALAMGKSTFYDYLYKFGLGSATGLKMYGEASGIVMPEKYVKNVDLARIGFGQTIAVTPMQLVSAVSAVVNGGFLMKPYIIEGIYTPYGQQIESYQSEQIRQVISPETSTIMRDILYNVVENGSGRNAQLEGYKVGGKTGTAQKYGEDGQVLHDKHISSFVAIAPADDPALVCLVVVDEPGGFLHYGSIVAAPYAAMILEDALPYLNIMPEYEQTDDNIVEVPDVRGLAVEEAKYKLERKGLGYMVEGYSGDVASQIPVPGIRLKKGERVILQLEQEDDNGESQSVEVPDVVGLSPIEVNNLLTASNLKIKIMSSGTVAYKQEPVAGSEVVHGDTIKVYFEDPPDEEN